MTYMYTAVKMFCLVLNETFYYIIRVRVVQLIDMRCGVCELVKFGSVGFSGPLRPPSAHKSPSTNTKHTRYYNIIINNALKLIIQSNRVRAAAAAAAETGNLFFPRRSRAPPRPLL